MAAINYPVLYQRDFSRDVPESLIPQKWQQKAIAALPLLTLHRSCRVPLSMVLSGTRAVTQMQDVFKAAQRKDMTQAVYQFVHSCLNTAALGLLFFQPALSYTATSFSDLIHDVNALKTSASSRDGWGALNAFSKGALDGLFIASLLYGSIEIVVLCATLQILSGLYNTGKHLRNGEYFEGFCQGILALAHTKQAAIQGRLLQWKYETAPLLEGTLQRNAAGFVYVDIPDEQVFSLLKYCGKEGTQPPPYFKPGMAGAHISVISAGKKIEQISQLGQKFSFRISHVDAFDLGGKTVHLVAVACPALEQVRLEQGLPRRTGGDHDFHITYGIEQS